MAVQPPWAAQTHTEAMDTTNVQTAENAGAEGRPARAGSTDGPWPACSCTNAYEVGRQRVKGETWSRIKYRCPNCGDVFTAQAL